MAIIAQLRALGNRVLTRIPEGALIAATVILACSGSFGLGMLAARESREGEVLVERLPMKEELPASMVAGAATTPVETPPEPVLNAGGQYVASKNGERYYLPWCGGVSRINEENKVWFASKAEAEAAGYTPAANCKGI